MGKIIVKNLKTTIILFLLINFSLIFVYQTSAAGQSFGEGLLNAGISAGFDDGFQSNLTLSQRIGSILLVATTFVGIIFLGLIIYAGYIWLMARGNEQEVARAKNIITYSIIGLVVVLSAYAITMFISTIWKSSLPPT